MHEKKGFRLTPTTMQAGGANMQSNKITNIKVSIGFDNGESATASLELSPDERFETMFASQVIPTYPMTVYVVTRSKEGGPQIVNKLEIAI